MSRKPHNHRARLERYYRAMLRSNHVAVIDTEAGDLQTLINWKTGKLITSASRRTLVDIVCDIPHIWTIYLAALCRDQHNVAYMKSVEVAPKGNYKATHLSEVIEAYCVELKATSNPNHLVGMAWIAIPDEVTLTEAQAERVFDTVGAWHNKPEAA